MISCMSSARLVGGACADLRNPSVTRGRVAYSRAPRTSLTFACLNFVSERDRAPSVRLSACPACTLLHHPVVGVVLVCTVSRSSISTTLAIREEHRYSISTSPSATDAAKPC